MEFTLFGKQYFINKILAFVIILALVIGAGLLGFFLKQVYQPLEEPVVKQNTSLAPAAKTEYSVDAAKPEEVPKIKVYVTGCVNKPGVVTIEKGQVIDDAIKMAGGATKDADLENINLAYKLDENVMLRIKAKLINKPAGGGTVISGSGQANQGKPGSAASKASPAQNPAKAAVNQGKASLAGTKMNSGVDIITDSLKTIVGEEEAAAQNSKSTLININKATQAELETLPNVGPATAKAIIDYREKNGEFKKVTDIMKITGIKQKTYDKIKDYICIE